MMQYHSQLSRSMSNRACNEAYHFFQIHNDGKLTSKRHKFSLIDENRGLDKNTKKAALKVSSSVVSLLSYSGEKELAEASGTIIEADRDNYIVLTSANLVRHETENTLAPNIKIVVHASDEDSYVGEIITYDFHYNLLMILFKSESSFQCANLRFIDLHQDVIEEDVIEEKYFRLNRHSVTVCHDFVKVKHGDHVNVVGRYFSEPFSLMAAPGFIRENGSLSYDCKELLVASCSITRCGDGSPLINQSGEMIGIAFFDYCSDSPFLPMNICCKWWNHYKNYKELRHPCYGLEVGSLYMADLSLLEKVKTKFPNITCGTLVQKVLPGSSGQTLRNNDIIVKCDGKTVKSLLELWDVMWDKVGQSVELEVANVDLGTVSSVSMVVAEAVPNALNKWPRWPDYVD